MDKKITLGILAILVLLLIFVNAGYGGFCRWNAGYGILGGGMMGFGMGWMWILLLALLLLGAFMFFSNGSERSKSPDILAERLARGEITKEQYEEIKETLR